MKLVKIGVRSFFIFIITLFLSCKSNTLSPSMKEITGIYMGRYFNGVETFEIDRDGTFSQEFKKEGVIVYQSKGKWEINSDKVINFSPFMSPGGAWDARFDKQPERTQVAPGSWNRQPIRIIFFEDMGYYLVKVKGVGATGDEGIYQP